MKLHSRPWARSVLWLFAGGLAVVTLWLFASLWPSQRPSGPRALGMAGAGAISLSANSDPAISGPVVGEPVAPVSFDGDVRDLPHVSKSEKTTRPELEFGFNRPGVGGDPNALDPIAQTWQGLEAMPAPIQNFKGLDLLTWGAGWPPDTHGDVGPDHYIQVVNTSVGIYDKDTTSQLAAFTFNDFFAGATAPCATNNNGDVIVLYDVVSGRWLISDFAWTDIANGPYYECIAVSKTADPVSGGWWLYTLRADDASHPWLNDYPKLGVWPDGIYVTANMFDCTDIFCFFASYEGVRVWALNRDDLISGAPLRSVLFDMNNTSYGALLPANYRGAPPPAGSPNYMLALGATNSTLALWKFHVDWVNTASSTFTGPTTINVSAYTLPTSPIPQPSPGTALDNLGDRLMSALQYRNIGGVEALWANHSVVSSGVTGIRWYEIRTPNATPTVFQQSTFQPDTTHRWMGSLAVDQSGNMALGYSVSSASLMPSVRYAGRLVTDTVNTLPQSETTLITGTGVQTDYFGQSLNRWGDYSSMSVDPSDDCTFWYTTEYYEVTGWDWQTRIGSFKFPSCGSGGPTPTPTRTATPGPSPTPTRTTTPGPSPTATPSATPGPGGGDIFLPLVLNAPPPPPVCTITLQDGGFEAFDGSDNPFWDEFSTNFDTPLCTLGLCGNGTGSAGPRTGAVWAWFGGTPLPENGSLSQSVFFPTASSTILQFYLWIGAAEPGSGTDDFVQALVDSTVVFSADATQIGSYPGYTLVTVDVSAFGNNASHTLLFNSITSGQTVNFNLDDVSLSCTS